MTLTRRRLIVFVLFCGLVPIPATRLLAQSAAASPSAQSQAAPADSQDQEPNPLNRPRSDKERYRQQRELRQELKGTYKTWLNEEVPYIISDQERKAFMSLSNDEERDAFIENFWQRRNPNPDSPDNTFRDEYYRRIAYANEHYAAGKPGWKTDRGRIYIMWGAADNIDAHPAGGLYQRAPEEGGGETQTFPWEKWTYRYLEGLGENVEIEFVDTCMCGDYHFTLNRGEKDALLHVPGEGLTNFESTGQSTKASRYGTGLENLGNGPYSQIDQGKEFDRMELAAKLFAPPPIKFKDLDAFVSEHKLMTGPVFPFEVRTDFVKVTADMDLVPITLLIHNRDITFVTKDGVAKGVVNILGKVTTLTDKTVQTFEDTVEVDDPAELLDQARKGESVYWKALPLQPGLYRLDIAIKDVNNSDHVGLYGRGIVIPVFNDEKLGVSSLILADKMNPVPSRDIGNGSFIIGNTFIRPRVSANAATPVSFNRTQSLSFWMQVYNLGIDTATKSNSAKVTYQITDSTGTVILQKDIESKDLGAHSDELTVQSTLPMAGLQPGKYKVTIKINDAISKQEIAQSAPFVVE
jgi:GWxTD domain-containing protein